jgi:hypothetical protein
MYNYSSSGGIVSKCLPCIVLFLAIITIALPLGLGCTQPGVSIVEAAGELNVWGDWSINPCKYEYQNCGKAEIFTTVTNLSSTEAKFNMGDGCTISIPAKERILWSYKFNYLCGQTERIQITKVDLTYTEGIIVQNAINLKIVPKGGE